MTRWNYLPQKNQRRSRNSAIICPFPDAGNGEFMKEPAQKPSKYHSSKVEVDGITFDSKKEARRYEELKVLQEIGEISDLELQKKFVLIPTQREPDIIGPRGGYKPGKVIEKEIAYYADFCYHDNKTNENVVEDVKSPSTRTEAYKAKRKMMLFFYGIRIKEV